MEAKLLSASSPPSFVVHMGTKFSRSSFVLTSLTREFPVFKLHCSAGLSKKAKKRVDASENLTLKSVRCSLIRQEDSIIFSLLERAQYCYNENTYDPEAFSMDGFHGSLVEYTSSDEHPFFPDDLPNHVLPHLENPQVLHPIADTININPKVWQMYFKNIIPKLAKEGDDGNCRSTAICDTMCLQALSKRIHYGKYVAECKYRASPDDYEAAIREQVLFMSCIQIKPVAGYGLMINNLQDRDRLMSLLTYPLVEESVKKRVEMKTMTYGQVVKDDAFKDEEGDSVYKIKPSLVADIYGDWIMPLTKEVQVEYLLRRLDLDGSQGN
ncbi:hypothetical protein V6N12_059565 [Hibiscus sabdariffa]|uniref:Chorismate mutase n=1 Tax=Hibiscus sabdariffa TaxID=183260 RepID=A0ABR2EVF7_9ROSI